MKNKIGRYFQRRMLLISAVLTALSVPVLGQGIAPFTPGIEPSHPGAYSNLIRLSLGSPFVNGAVAQYMQRHRVPDAVFGGLEALHLERFVGAQGLLTLDGRAIPANDEYRFNLKLDVPDVGFARAGINNFKVRYAGAGGYFLPLNEQFVPRDTELAMDRGETWIEGGLRLPSLPDLTVRYTRRFRDGTKPSLSWGDSQDLGEFGTRNIAPSFWKSDEVRNIFDADITETFGKTAVGISARLETGDIKNSLNVWRRPGEPEERFLTDTETVKSDVLRLRAGTVTALRQDLTLSTNFVHETLDGEVGGGRIYGAEFGASFDPAFPNRQRRDHGFLDIDGTTSRTRNSGSLNLRFRKGAFTVVPTVRIDQMDINGALDVTDTNVEADGSVTLTPLNNASDRSVTDLTGGLEVRYAGIENVVLYARGDWMDRDGSLFEEELETQTGAVEFNREANDSRTTQRYRVGANWHASRRVLIAMQASRKTRSVDYDHVVNADGPLTYPGFLQSQGFETDHANVRIRWRPDARLTLTGRLEVRRTLTEGSAEGLGTFESSEITHRVFTGSVLVAPIPQVYVQGNVTTSRNRILTPINELEGAVADIVLESKSDYVSANVSVGVAVSEKADLMGSLFYLQTDNFVDNSSVGLPFDLSAEEQGFSAEGTYALRPDLVGSVRFYHFLNRDDTFGGSQDYDLNLVYLGVTYRF